VRCSPDCDCDGCLAESSRDFSKRLWSRIGKTLSALSCCDRRHTQEALA